MRTRISQLVLIAGTAFLPVLQSCQPSSKAAAPVMLQFNPEKGRGYDYQMQWNIDQGIMGNINMVSGYSLDVTGTDGEDKQITAVYNDIRCSMKILGKEIEIDTKKQAAVIDSTKKEQVMAAMMNRIFSAMIGKKFVMTVNKEGKLVKLEGMEEMVMSVMDSMPPEGKEDMQPEAMKKLVKEQMSEEMVREQFTQFFFIFPAREVKEGDSWEKSFKTMGKVPGDYVTTYTVKDIEGDHMTLRSKSKIDGGEEEMKVSGTQEGNFLVDTRSGLIINAEIEQDIIIKPKGFALQVTGKGTIKGKAR